jgi:hypothetical protein
VRLNRHDDGEWRALARSRGISDHVARRLWTRAEAEAAHDLAKIERAFRRMLDDAKAFDALALERVARERGDADPGRSTRVLDAEPRPAHAPTIEPTIEPTAASPASQLRDVLEAALHSGERVVRSIAVSDAKTVGDALRRLGDPGSPLAILGPDTLSQLLRLADGLVTMIEQSRAGDALPTDLRQDLEARLGSELGDLRIHDDPASAALARKHDAVAFAQGRDVFFADGMYDPASPAGRALIAHEATHVVQQRGGSRAASGALSEPGSAVEREADRVASAFTAGVAPGAPALAIRERAAAGTISRKTSSPTVDGDKSGTPDTSPKSWKLTLLGQVLDLSSRLATARDAGSGDKLIDINQSVGPLRIQQARFASSGGKVTSGSLIAAIDSGAFHGTTGTLTVDASGKVSGSLTVPINAPGLFVKQVTVDVSGESLSAKIQLAPSDFVGPDFPIKTSDFELTLGSTATGLTLGLTGSAEAAIDNGLAQGQAKMVVDLHADSSGVTFAATLTGKLAIAGLANADATLKYDGKAVTIEAGGTVPVQLPGLEGTATIQYAKGKLSIDSKDLHFTLPQLAPIKFDNVLATQSKLSAQLHLASPIVIPLPGGASLSLDKSSIAIDGTVVSGDLTGTFALNNAGGLTGKVQLAYAKGGDLTGSVNIAGGARFTVAGVEVTIDNASTLTVEKGLGVSGDVAGKIKLPGIPEIAVHVVAQAGQPIDLTCDTTIKLQSIVPQLGGDVHVQYHRGGGANAFSFDASNVSVAIAPLNGQVIFSTLRANLEGGQITGLFTAAPGTTIKNGTASVTIDGGTIHLLPNRILDGNLKAHADAGGSQVEAVIGWKQGKFDWSADGTFDLGPLTRQQLRGKVHATAGGGHNTLVAEGPITFGSPALAGVEITALSGDKESRRFTITVDAHKAVDNVLKKVPNVQVTPKVTTATVVYDGNKLAFTTAIAGSAQYPKSGPSQLSGDFHMDFAAGQGFTGGIDNVKLTAADYFHSEHGKVDLESGEVSLGDATFSIPDIGKGKISSSSVNVNSGKFHVEADFDAQMVALKGLKLHVILENQNLTASMREGSAMELGSFATLHFDNTSKITIAKGAGISAQLAGTLDARTVGKGRFDMTYGGHALKGTASVHVEPFALFNAVDLDLALADRKVSTQKPVELKLAPAYENLFAASATLDLKDNQLAVVGRVTEVKNLGKISEAFKNGHGAQITYSAASHQVSVSTTLDVGGSVIPELDTGSLLKFDYAGHAFQISGTLKPKDLPGVSFKSGSHITALWSSVVPRLIVTGQAKADLDQLCEVDLSVDSALGNGQPGSFGMKGHVDASKLAEKFPGVTFSSVAANFTVLVGQGKQRELDFHLDAGIGGVPAAGITDMSAQLAGEYKHGQGLTGTISVARAKIGDVIADGSIQLERGLMKAGSLHLRADLPSLTIEGNATIAAGALNELNTTAELKVSPGGSSPLAKLVQSGTIHVDITRWKLANAEGQLHLAPPSFLPLEDPTIKVGYRPGVGLHADLSTRFAAPMAKHGEKGTFVAGYDQGRGLYAHIEFPITVPGFQAATVAGDLDAKGIQVSATLVPKDATIVKQANVEIGYDFGGGFYVQGSITLKPTEELELVVGLRYDQKAGLQVQGITPHDKAATPQDHEVANWHKDFPTIPLASVGVASLGLKFGLGVAAGYRMPRIAFKNPQLEGGLDALDKGGMPAFTFGGQIAMGAYIALSMSVQVAGEIQLLIATCDAGIGAEIAARLNLELGADVNGRFAPGEGAHLQIDPFVGASLDLIASLIATLHAEVCWFTIVDKKWTLASTNFAHIDLGSFHPFNPLGLQFGGPGGTRLTNGLTLRDDAFDQIKEGVKNGAQHAGDEEANEDARKRISPVLRAFKSASHQFEQLPPGWENGMIAPPVEFHSMFPVSEKEWDFYQDHADNAEKIDPSEACVTPTEKLAKAVGVTARKDPMGAGRLILAWRRAQIASKGINPDTGVNVVQEREVVQAEIMAKYQAELAAVLAKQKQQDLEHTAHVQKQTADFQTAEATHIQTSRQQKTTHDANVVKTQGEWHAVQQKKTTAAKHAKDEGVKVEAKKEEKAPPPPLPEVPPLPKALAKPAPIPVPPRVPMPLPPEQLPAVTLPALPADPGVSVHAASVIVPTQKKVAPQSPGAKQAPTGGSPDPMPGTSSNAKQAGGGGGAPANLGGASAAGKGGAAGGGSTSTAPRPGPAVTAGPDGIIAQQKTLDAKENQLSGKAPGATPAAPGKPGTLGTLGSLFGASTAGAPAPANANAAKPGATPAPTTAAPATDGKHGDGGSGGLDPTVQKVVEQGKTDELAYKQKLGQQDQTYKAKVTEDDKATETEAKKLDKAAEEAKKRKEREARDKTNAGGPDAAGPDKDGADKTKAKPPFGTRVPLDVHGESHTLYIDDHGTPMVASTPTAASAKLDELAGTVSGAPSIKQLAEASVRTARADLQPVVDLGKQAASGDASANTALPAAEHKLAAPLKITWAWAKVAVDPAVAGGSIDNPLLHPYYPTFKSRLATLSSLGHITDVDAAPFADKIWTEICKAVKVATPMIKDPEAYANFAKGWLDMESPKFVQAIQGFEHLGQELAKAASAQFARASNFGFWSKDEGRALAEAISDLTLETSAIGSLMDGLPTLDGKQAGWDPEVWGALSNAYATAVVPELLKGKKIKVCVGAGVVPGNIWQAVESKALIKGLRRTQITLEGVTTNYAAAARSKDNRRELDPTKATQGIHGCVFVGDRAGAVAAAEAHFKTLDQPAAAAPAAKDAALGTRVPMTVGGEGHTQYIDPSGKPMVASTPIPVTEKLAELNAKLAALASTAPRRAEAITEIAKARGLESRVADLAAQVKRGVATAATELATTQTQLAASVAKIWDVADPGVLDATKAKHAIDSRATDCADISTPLAADWVGKTRAELESQFIDTGALRHAAIAKYLAAGADKAKIQTIGSLDPIAVQKFQDVDSENHVDPRWGDLKTKFYQLLGAELVKPAFTDRARTYPAMKDAAGFLFTCKGTQIPADRIAPHSARNHSIDRLYDLAQEVPASVAMIDHAIEGGFAPGTNPARVVAAKRDEGTRHKAYRHLIKTMAKPLDTINRAKPISQYGTWYAPGEIIVNTSAPPNQEFARMMTLGALQPEWYPSGTAVLHIDRRLSGGARQLFKPTAFDGLMSSLWCARNLGENDYGVTGGGLGEFLELNVPFSDVTQADIIVPSDDFLAELQRLSTEAAARSATSTPTEELLRDPSDRGRLLSTATPDTQGVKDMYGKVLDRSKHEQAHPGRAPVAPGAVKETSSATPGAPAAAPHGAYDPTRSP